MYFKEIFTQIIKPENIITEKFESFTMFQEDVKDFNKFVNDIIRKYKNTNTDFVVIEKMIPNDTFGTYKLYFYKDYSSPKMVWNWLMTYDKYKTYDAFKKARTDLDKNSHNGRPENNFTLAVKNFQKYIEDSSEIV